MRFLESHNVAYEVFEFSPAIHNAVEVAAAVGAAPATVYKTLVVERPEGKPLLAIVPAPDTLDLKALASATGDKKLTMASHADAERLTGLKVGGISALALVQKHWDVVLDASAEQYPAILVSAGERGVNLRIAVSDLKKTLHPRVAPVARKDN